MAQRFSLIPEVISGVVAGMQGTSGFRTHGSRDDGVTVYDGPEWIGINSSEPDGFLVIGYGGEDLETRGVDNDPSPMPQQTEIRAISPAAVKEQLVEIPCVAYARGNTPALARSAVFAIVDLVEVWLTNNPRCGVAVQADNSQVIDATATGSHEFRQYVDDSVFRAVVEFTITAKTRT